MLSNHPDHFRRLSCYCAARAFYFTSFASATSKSFTIRTSKTPLPQPLYNPHLQAPLGSAGNKGLITPLESALTRNSPASLLESALTKRWGVGVILATPEFATRHSSLATGFKFFYFHTLPNSFALAKNSTLLFSYKSTLFAQNTGGGGCELQDGLDFGVEGHVRGGESVDREFLPAGFGKMKEAADVVVLVVSGEKALGFGSSQVKGRERDRLAKISGVGAVQTHEIAQGHHIILRPRTRRRIWRPRSGRRSAARCFGAHGILLRQSVLRRKREGRRPT